MKVALIAPPYPLEEAPSPPLGICYAAAAFEDAGADVVIFDYIVRRYTPEKFKKEIDAFQPDIIGTNSVTMNFIGAAGILKIAKQHAPDAITMMGGPHVTFDVDNTLRQYPEIDIIVVGEGEQTIKEILPVIRDKEKWKDIKGIAFVHNGEIVKTGIRDFIQDLDSLPLPARQLLPMSRYQALGFPVSLITSRGCPNQCIFCQGRRMVGRKVRYRSPLLVADEIEHILSYGFTRINIADDFFTSNKERVRLVCDEILKRKINFSWSAFARVDSVDRECLKMMLKAGCDTVSFGIESGNPEMLKRVKKRITLEQVREAVQCCKDTGMRVFASFMLGLPGESHQTLKDTANFADELGIEYGYHFLAPFPGTTLWEEMDSFDVEILTDDWNRYDANRPIVRTSHLSAEDLDTFYQEFDEKVKDIYRETELRYKNGNCTPHEQMLIEGYQRMQFVFDLLSKDIIEEHASFKAGDSESDYVTDLSDNISRAMNNTKPVVAQTLKSLVDTGYIKYRHDGDRINWYWTHNNQLDALPFS